MIPIGYITSWRSQAPWPEDWQVEQDLIISRALVDLFNQPTIAEQAAFRGGTALHKIFIKPSGRYSEDIDLVQLKGGPIGELISAVHAALDPWLGTPNWKQGRGRFTLYYKFETSSEPIVARRLKVEINTREHLDVLGIQHVEFSVRNPWFTGSTIITTYHLAELLGTKMRALYQRKKGRDAFDLSYAIQRTDVSCDQIVECFSRYMEFEERTISRAEFEANLIAKLEDLAFMGDTSLLLSPSTTYDPQSAIELVRQSLLAKLAGEPWKGLDLQNTEARISKT